MIFGGDYRVEPSVLDEIDRGRPDKRREQVLTALKRRLKDSATGALDVLSNPGSGDDVANLRELYIAGALSFEANAAMVARLGRLPGDGAMFHDNLEASYDAIRADRAPTAPTPSSCPPPSTPPGA